MAIELSKTLETSNHPVDEGTGELGLTGEDDNAMKTWPESLCPYREVIRWRRRFWWSFALNVAFAVWLAWHEK